MAHTGRPTNLGSSLKTHLILQKLTHLGSTKLGCMADSSMQPKNSEISMKSIHNTDSSNTIDINSTIHVTISIQMKEVERRATCFQAQLILDTR